MSPERKRGQMGEEGKCLLVAEPERGSKSGETATFYELILNVRLTGIS